MPKRSEVSQVKYCISFKLALNNDLICFQSTPLPSIVHKLFFINETKLMSVSITYQSKRETLNLLVGFY